MVEGGRIFVKFLKNPKQKPPDKSQKVTKENICPPGKAASRPLGRDRWGAVPTFVDLVITDLVRTSLPRVARSLDEKSSPFFR